MGNFEKLSVVVIVVIIVMILVVALNTWTERPEAASSTDAGLVGGLDPFPPEPDEKTGRTDSPPFPDPFPDPLPMPPTPAPRPVKSEPRAYVVRSGDTLGGIAARELGSTKHVAAVRELNPTLDEVLRIGDTIQLPHVDALQPDGLETAPDSPLPVDVKPGGVYVTKKGDTWDRISRLVYKTKDRWHHIFAMNSDIHQNVNTPLPEGSRIRLPK